MADSRPSPDTGADVGHQTALAWENMTDWCPDMSVGIPEIDNDHKILIELIDKIGAMMILPEGSDPLQESLESLRDFADYHFHREEGMMRAMEYEGFGPHRGKHNEFLLQLEEIIALYVRDRDRVDFPRVRRFFREWLFRHICVEDRKYMARCAGQMRARRAVMSVGMEYMLDNLRN